MLREKKEQPHYLEEVDVGLSLEEIQLVASKYIQENPSRMDSVLHYRWQMELNRGTIHFDPNDPNSYREIAIGKFIKRTIPDRMLPKSEKLSGNDVPVYCPFDQKFSSFDYTMAPPEQKLFTLQLENGNFDVLASNSPLSKHPHALLIPTIPRAQFLLGEDLHATDELLSICPHYCFTYSSMGGGAGVNQQHLHMIGGQEAFPISSATLSPIYNINSLSILRALDWNTDSFIITGPRRRKNILAISFIKFLQGNNIPHNVFITNEQIWINPRSRKTSNIIEGKKYGTWETILGICNCCSWEEYNTVNETLLNAALQELRLDVTIHQYLREKLCALADGINS